MLRLTKLSTDYYYCEAEGVPGSPAKFCPGISNAELLELPRADAPPGAPMGTDDYCIECTGSQPI